MYFGKLNKNAKAVAVIMAGGHGTRFWPLSTKKFPKQFLSITPDNLSLIQKTAERLKKIDSQIDVLVVSGECYLDLIKEHLPEANVLAEPAPKNTAPCIALAAAVIQKEIGDVPMICLPADHLIKNEEELVKIMNLALAESVAEEALITIGIKPDRPETGYGYIKFDKSNSENKAHRAVDCFVEKPNLETAQTYLASGEYYWNSGMFVWRPSVLLSAVKEFLPKLNEEVVSMSELLVSGDIQKAMQIFRSLESISIDYGIMEKAKNVVMFPGENLAWSDVGGWIEWAKEVGAENKDSQNNVIKGDVLLEDSKNCAVLAKNKLIACVGVSDLIVVETDEAILICTKDQAQNVKKIVEKLKENGREGLL